MNEANWNECLEDYKAIRITPNKGRIQSLIQTSQSRIKFLNTNIINEQNARFIFEGQYTSMLELLKAYLNCKGYKIENHTCVGYYLRDVLKREDLYRTFNDARIKRNNIVYYGRDLPLITAKQDIQKITGLMKEIILLIKI